MRKPAITMLAAAAAAFAALASVPVHWTVEMSRVQPASFTAYRGETLELSATMLDRGRPAETPLGEPRLYWQTNGMGSAYWTAPASCASNVLFAVWSPTNDVGSASYNCFIGMPGGNYRAAFQLRFLDSPGFVPNTLPPPEPASQIYTSGASVPIHWTVETSKVQPVQFSAYRGETLELTATALSYGKPYEGMYESPALYWQTNGMGAAYWTAPASSTSNVLYAVWSPTNDVGAASYNCFIGVPGGNYRTAFQLRLVDSPGSVPNALPLPAAKLDFGSVEVVGAPWPGEIAAAVSPLQATNALQDVTLAYHSSQLTQLSQSLANKLDKTGEQTLDGSLTATGFLNAPSINFPGSSAYIDASDDTIVFHSTQKPSGSPFGGQVIEESPLKPDGTAVVTQLGLLPLTETNAAQDAHLATVDGRLDSLDSQISGKADAVKQAVLADTWTGTVWGAIAVCLTNRYDGVWAGTATNPAGFPLDAHLECSGSDGDYEWELAIPEFALTSQGRTDAIPGDGETLTLDDGSLIRHFEYSSSPVVYEDALAEAASDSVRAIESATNSLAAAVADTYQPKGSYLTSETDPTAISAVSNVMTAAGVETDYLAQWRGSSVRGGVRIRYSSRNEDNLTAYLYNGVAVRRNGTTDDFLFGTTNQYGVVRFRDLEPIITSICLSLIGNVYWQSDDNGRTMDAYYRDAETISNIVSTAVAYIAETRATAFIRIEPDGAAGVYQPDAEEMGGVADRAATRQREGADDE